MSNIYIRVIQVVTARLCESIALLLPRQLSAKILYWRIHRRVLHIKKPRTFSEFIFQRMLLEHTKDILWTVNKSEVKDKYIDLIKSSNISCPDPIETLWSGCTLENFPEIAPEELWVFKPTFGFGGHGIIFGKGNITDEIYQEINVELNRFLKKTLTSRAWAKVAWAYNNTREGYILEKNVTSGSIEPTNFGVYVFGGKAKYIVQIDGLRSLAVASIYQVKNYLDWERVNISLKPYEQLIPQTDLVAPPFLQEMLKAAEQISKNFDYMRVDFLFNGKEVHFLELDPYTGFSIAAFPHWFDKHLGDLWNEARSSPAIN